MREAIVIGVYFRENFENINDTKVFIKCISKQILRPSYFANVIATNDICKWCFEANVPRDLTSIDLDWFQLQCDKQCDGNIQRQS